MAAHGKPIHNVTAPEIEALIARMEASLSPEDSTLAASIIQGWAHIYERLAAGDLTLAALRRLLDIAPPPPRGHGSSPGSGGTSTPSRSGCTGAATPDADDGAEDNHGAGAPPWHEPHGRRAAEAMGPLQLQRHRHEVLNTGCACPDCKRGRLYRFEPRAFTSIVGQAPLVGIRHEQERLRCNRCKKVFAAPLPKEVAKDIGPGQLYAYSAQTMVVIHKYFGAMPWHRQALLQAAIGVAVPDASMWHMSERLANMVLPIARSLTRIAASAPLLQGDDTSSDIIEHRSELRVERKTGAMVERTGVHTSCVVATTGAGQVITIFQVGIQHAGELLDHVLKYRDKTLPAPLFVSDAGSSNTATVCEIRACGCNAHAVRRFKDIADTYPKHCTHVLGLYGRIFEHDRALACIQADDNERLAFHREYSRPLLRQIALYGHQLLHDHAIEPNDPLGGACNYILGHEHELAAFCRYPGVPLTNNLVERILRLPIRLRDVPAAFKNTVGARVAQTLWTVGGTALAARENVFDYFNALQPHADDVRARPRLWLPWCFRERLSTLEPASSSRSPPATAPAPLFGVH